MRSLADVDPGVLDATNWHIEAAEERMHGTGGDGVDALLKAVLSS